MKAYASQLVAALIAIHKSDVCHRDLKLENLVLDADFKLKVIDFGLACDLSGDAGRGFCSRGMGSPGYLAPEILGNVDYQPIMADMFALGVIFFIMKTGFHPFKLAIQSDPQYKLLLSGRQNLFWQMHEKNFGSAFSVEFKDLIENMLAF